MPNKKSRANTDSTSKKSARKGKAASNSQPPEPKRKAFPIVGIGASAGGLSALKQLFSHIPPDSGLAFVVVVHLAPESKSHLAELLQPHVKMPVEQVTETVALEKNRVYVIPPNANLNTIDTHLRLSKLEEHRQQRAPIDHFFRTLAQTHDGDAIGVILTGTGSDGTLGLREIKEHGGIAIAQDPNEAEYDGMPQSAISTGQVDLVLPLAEISKALLESTRIVPKLPALKDIEEHEGRSRKMLQGMFTQLRAHTGRDFDRYKRSTILRRIYRRMQLRRIEEFEGYLEVLRQEPEEARILADDLLITVTSFFRDPEVFQALETKILPAIFDLKRSADDEIRVWSVGCSTGEEAYSLAMLLVEEAGRREFSPRLQVFASDLHDHSIKQAREGFYPGDIETDISPERLKRFFLKENGSYRVRKEIREMVVFSPHNLLSDPPFSRLDLISCRNLLIYIQREVQRDVVDLFHYALRPDGYLVLGTSETVDESDLFRLDNKECCIYQKRNVRAPEPRLPVFPIMPPREHIESDRPESRGKPAGYGMLHQHMVERHALPSALVCPDNKLVHLSENAGRYLTFPGGEPTTSIIKIVREELQLELRALLASAREQGRMQRSKPIPVRFNGETCPVILHVRPAQGSQQEGYVLIIFDELEHMAAAAPEPEPSKTSHPPKPKTTRNARERELETELILTRQRLQAIIEEYETGQEEMKASNEEFQSTNEELRSTMEELETSKEELQSMNEELQAVNQENRHKVEELAQLSGDLQNLLSATDIATLFLNREFRILRFTSPVAELFNVQPTDRGRPITDLTHRLGYKELVEDAKEVLARLIPIEREVLDASGRWYLARVMPYRSAEDRIEGVVLTFVDITNLKQAENEVREAKYYAEQIIETLPEPLLVLTAELRVKSANAAFYEHFQEDADRTEGRLIYELGNGQWNVPDLRRLLEEILPTKSAFNGFQVEHTFDELGHRVMLLNARQLDHLHLILLGVHDITERHQAEHALRKSEERLKRILNIDGVGVLTFDEAGTLIDANAAALKLIDYTREEIQTGKLTWQTMTPPEYMAISERELRRLEKVGRIGPYEKEYLRKNGSRSWMVFAGANLGDGTFIEYCIDVSDRKKAEEALKAADRRKDEFLATLAHELRNPLAPICSGLELIRMAQDKAKTFEEISGMLERQTQQLTRLVEDLLDVSRITQGKLELRKCQVQLSDVLSAAIEESQPLIDEPGHHLTVSIPEEPISLNADPNRLAQVLSNLLNNAARYTPEGGHIQLAVEKQNGTVVISVKDDGIGIRPEELEGIFEIFGQIPQPMEKVSTGLGIGLSLVKSLVEMHGGSIQAQSEGPNRGTEFRIQLPILSEVSAATEKRIEPKPSTEPGEVPHRRVLIVDDNKSIREMSSRVIKMLGHEVRTACDGEEAVALAAEFRPEVILMDLGMPKMDGHEATRRIRQEAWGKDMIIVALSGWGQDKDRQMSGEAGFDEHLVKPADPANIQRILASAKKQSS